MTEIDPRLLSTRPAEAREAMPLYEGLTPSDLIFLDDAEWRAPDESGRRILSSKPTSTALDRAIAAAFLANEKAGNLRLTLEEARYARLVKFTHLTAHVSGPKLRWPAGSLEARLMHTGHVDETIYRWVGEKYSDPRSHVVDKHLDSMAERNLLKGRDVQRRFLGLVPYSSRVYELSASTDKAFTGQALTAATSLLDDNAMTRPEIHRRLLSAIGHGFSRRTIPIRE